MKTIHLKPYDLVGIDNRGLVSINGDTYINPEYYNIKAYNPTQRKVIEQATPELSLHKELQQLTNIDRLKKKLITYFNNIEKLKYLSGDDRIIKQRSINKSNKTIKKYFKELRQDTNFKIERVENTLKLCYSGKYVNAVKVVLK